MGFGPAQGEGGGGGVGEDLEATLALGNITGASDLVVTAGQKISGAALTLSSAAGDLTLDTVNDGSTLVIGGVVGTIEIATNAASGFDKEIFIGTNASATSEISVQIGDIAAAPSSEVCLNAGSTGRIQLNARTGSVELNDAADVNLDSVAFTSTSIIGAFNELGRGRARITNGSAVTVTTDADTSERVLYDPSGGTFTIRAPATPTISDHWAVKNFSASLTAITISGNGSNIEDPTISFALAASFSLSGDGIAVEWEYDGTQWVVI